MKKTPTTRAAAPQIKPAALRTFHAALAAWYRAHGRHDLPWRNTDDPYHIWLSEVMLQQTQVATVRERFYQPFLKKFPSIEALAKAEQTKVLKAWEGLGYYSRARNLHKASKEIVCGGWWVVGGGKLPPLTTHYTLLTSLPGIGRNTASAILAFAYHQPIAILEANVKRVVARIFALEAPSDAELWAGAEALLNKSEPFDYNQTMMDLGSMVCIPKKPNCPACPARSICRGKTTPELYPAPKVKKQVPTRRVDILVREDAAEKLFLEARDAKLLGGMYGFPQVSPESLVASRDYLGEVTHIYSHFKLIGRVMYEKRSTRSNSGDWHSRAEIAQLPLSKLDHKVLALVDRCHSVKKKIRKAPASRGKR